MGRFIITEEEKSRIRGLYEYVDESDTFLDQFSRIYGVPLEEISNINVSSGQTQIDIAKNTLMGPLKEVTLQHVRDNGSFDKVLNQLKSYQNGQIGVKGVMNEEQKLWLNDFIKVLQTVKPVLEKRMQSLSQEEFEKLWRPLTYSKETPSNEPPSTEEKINTTNDRTYDYKLSGGKYYYSLKGQNKWIEANGKGLESIKSKINFS